MKYVNILIGCLLAFTAVSCDDFLDVRPKAEKLESDLFKNAQGFEDAIYGVYGSLPSTALYGRYLTWGIPEVLAQNLESTNSAISELSEYKYEDNSTLRSMFSSIWTEAYQTICKSRKFIDELRCRNGNLPIVCNFILKNKEELIELDDDKIVIPGFIASSIAFSKATYASLFFF